MQQRAKLGESWKMWCGGAYTIIHSVLHVIHHIPHIEHDPDGLHEACLRMCRVHVISGRKRIGMRKSCDEHFHTDKEVL